MPYARAVARKLDYYPWYEWVEPMSKWEDDEWQDDKQEKVLSKEVQMPEQVVRLSSRET